MRGKRSDVPVQSGAKRITPAYAGKTAFRRRRRAAHKDHPRVCGENVKRHNIGGAYAGSPPRMRGKRNFVLRIPDRRRITPAYAGKTRSLSASLPRARDHPRVCGENAFGLSQALSLSGSPPRMRGKPILFALSDISRRITPAYAGKTTLSAFICSSI